MNVELVSIPLSNHRQAARGASISPQGGASEGDGMPVHTYLTDSYYDVMVRIFSSSLAEFHAGPIIGGERFAWCNGYSTSMRKEALQ